jgi:hypothetical protein
MNIKDYNTLPLPLTSEEVTALASYEWVIRDGLSTFYKVGTALVEIRNRKLYRGEHRTFEAYLREKWGITRQRAYQLIDAAAITDDLSTTVDILPQNENQARALKSAPADQRAEIWQKAVDANHGSQPTAKHIQQAIQTELPMQADPDEEPADAPARVASPQVYDEHMPNVADKQHNTAIECYVKLRDTQREDDMPDDDQPHAWRTEDRIKIVNAGLRLYRAHNVPRPEIRQFVPNDAGNFGSWRILEKFETIAALKRRYDAMKTDPNTIFEMHL